MTITINDPALLAQLIAAHEPTGLCGPDGDHVGTFQPNFGKPPPGFQSPFTDEQLAELRKVRAGRPLADILRDLEKREQ